MSDEASKPVAAPAKKPPKQGGGGSDKKPKPGAKAVVNLEDISTPEFWKGRVELFEELYAIQQAEYAKKRRPIKVTLADGKQMDAEAFLTTPLDIAKKLSNSLPDKVFVAKLNDETLWDLGRPFEDDCTMELLDWDDLEARQVFWHSSAHILGYALERVFPECRLVTGPPLEEGGFFYEGDTGRTVGDADYAAIDKAMETLVRQKAPYQRLALSKDHLLKMFGYNSFKCRTLARKVPDGAFATVYRCGDLIDPCRGPHLPDTGRMKAFCVTKNSSSYYLGNAENEVLQRVYAQSFPKNDMMKEWKQIQADAEKRDHRRIGKQQELFQFHDVSPGSAFWLPHGARIYNALIEFQRKQYRRRGFEEVVSPNMYNAKLWMVSGHWELYKDAMFRTECEHEDFGLKPMNCPGHCVMFGMRPRSYKELPVRWADFGALHRNELSGALSGLTRVRRFQQDDAHIFCRMDQVTSEIEGALEFLRAVYDTLGFNFFLKLSTRPENALGARETWNEAEAHLMTALNAFCQFPASLPDITAEGATFKFDGSVAARKKLKRLLQKISKDGAVEGLPEGWKGPKYHPWEENPGDGAFYGPKIDIVVEDALKRKHQCATIQLDFQLPDRFGLKYTLAQAREGAQKEKEEKAAAASAAKSAAAAAKPNKGDESGMPSRSQTQSSVHADPHLQPTDHKHGAPPAAPAKKELNFVIDRHLEPNQERPVMIHRAIFGSIERCTAILCEHYGGKWPFWLSPRQVMVVPVSREANDYAMSVRDQIFAEGYHADADVGASTMEKKVAEAQTKQYNVILVVGHEEEQNKTVDVRVREDDSKDKKDLRKGKKTIPELLAWFDMLAKTYSREF